VCLSRRSGRGWTGTGLPLGNTGRVSAPPETRLIWLLRHAKTRHDPPRGGTDHDRRLSPRGRRDAEALGRRLAAPDGLDGLGPGDRPGAVLSSNARRTLETVELVLAPLADPPPVTSSKRLYGALPADVLHELQALDGTLGSVMVVGHNPTWAELAVTLAPPDDPLRERVEKGFPTCALAVYRFGGAWSDVAPGAATMVGVYTPPF